jgi:hypothetical protein
MGAYFNEKQKCYFPTVVSFFETTICINIQNPIEQPYNFVCWRFQGSPLSGAYLSEKLLYGAFLS